MSDSSLFIINPEKIKIKHLPNWYSTIYQKIKNESGIEPDYLIRMELTELPEEYTDEILWNEYINQIRAKQYDIPIYLKNEVLQMNEYKNCYNKIDLIGLNDINKVNEIRLPLYIDTKTKYFYIKEDNKLYNVKDKNELSDICNIVELGIILMFIVTKEYFNEEL